MDRGYIHEYSLKKRRQESYPVRKPIKDMVLYNNGSILCVNENEIFKFDTKTQKLNLLPDIKLWTIYVRFLIFSDNFTMQLRVGMEMYGLMIFEQVWKARP